MASPITLEKKVLRIFGRVIRPANWIIFLAGIVLMIVAPLLYWVGDFDFIGTAILWVQGVQLAVEGYGEIKDDEDL